MNPVFILLVLIGAVALWFLLSFVFLPLGKFIYRIGKDATDAMNKDNNDEEKEKEL